MRTIALEEHFLASGFRQAMEQQIASSGNPQRPFPPALQARLEDVGQDRLHDMDAAGIDCQVLSHTVMAADFAAGEEERQLTRQANEQIARTIAAHDTRFAGFATLPMHSPAAAVSELEYAVTSLGLQGAMINGMSDGRFLDAPEFLPLLERAASLQVPLYLHPGIPPLAVRDTYYAGFEPALNFALATGGWGWHSETGIHALRLILAGVFDRFPDLQIIIGHMGEMVPFMLDRINNVFASLARHLQRPLPEYFLNNFYITTSGFFTDPPLLLALEIMGAERILFAVDYPFSANAQGRAFLEKTSLDPLDKEKICHLNAERLLKLPATGA